MTTVVVKALIREAPPYLYLQACAGYAASGASHFSRGSGRLPSPDPRPEAIWVLWDRTALRSWDRSTEMQIRLGRPEPCPPRAGQNLRLRSRVCLNLCRESHRGDISEGTSMATALRRNQRSTSPALRNCRVAGFKEDAMIVCCYFDQSIRFEWLVRRLTPDCCANSA